MQPRIIHVSGDFPDPVAPGKTAAIRRLLELTGDRFDHRVISLNRFAPPWREVFRPAYAPPRLGIMTQPFEAGEAWSYRAPPRGLWHRTMLQALGDRIADSIAHAPVRPALLVGHKLGIEGVAVARAAARLGVPYAVSVQGNTDARILAARPDLRRLLRRVWHGAAVAFPFAPWARTRVEALLGPRTGPTIDLPCARERDVTLPPRAGGNGFVSAFHLQHWRTKNLDGLLAAQRMLEGAAEAHGAAPPLGIIGGGDDAVLAQCRQLARGNRTAVFEGPLPNAAMPARLNAATALVLPSRRESFGIVFLEALCAGAPVIYPAGQAIDGYFDGAPFAIRVNARSPAAIAAAMRAAREREGELKAALAAWQAGPGPERFSRQAIGAAFAGGLAAALAPSGQ